MGEGGEGVLREGKVGFAPADVVDGDEDFGVAVVTLRAARWWGFRHSCAVWNRLVGAYTRFRVVVTGPQGILGVLL